MKDTGSLDAEILQRTCISTDVAYGLEQVLAMVEDEKLDVGGNSPQKLCLVACCYHNIAVSTV